MTWKSIDVKVNEKVKRNGLNENPVIWIFKKDKDNGYLNKRIRCIVCGELTDVAVVIKGWIVNHFCPKCWKTFFEEKLKPVGEHLEEVMIEEQI